MAPFDTQPEVEGNDAGVTIRIGADTYDLTGEMTDKLLDDIQNARGIACSYCGETGRFKGDDCIVCEGKGWHK